MKTKFIFSFLVLFLLTGNTNSFGMITHPREVAILDMSARNMETSTAELFSIKHIMSVAGIPYIVTDNVTTAVTYKVLIASSQIKSTSLNSSEENELYFYVIDGGCLMVPNLLDTMLYPVFGVSDNSSFNLRSKISFLAKTKDPSLRWLNDTLEQTISIGDTSNFSTFINTRDYIVSGATPLAVYDDNSIAITKNIYGLGKAYALGFSFKSMIILNQTDHDFEAQRFYSNGFEPSSDALILFIKAICLQEIKNSVWLHTSPFDSKSALIITHDVDAASGYDTMSYFANYESSIGVSSTYFLTTHYLNDGCAEAYYNAGVYPKVKYLLTKGQKIGSHSVGHFHDFDDENIFPYGTLGNDTLTYQPFSLCNGKPTVGATVLGETEVSKNLLEVLTGIKIRSFRAGYFCSNDQLINALDTLDYEYNSTLSAADVLTNFPFLSHKDRSVNGGISKIWEIPMTVSDVFNNDKITSTNYHSKVAIWRDVILRNRLNYAPSVLLIHPTRTYKVLAESELLKSLPKDMLICDLETYADFWKKRDKVKFTSTLSHDTLTIILPKYQLPLDSSISFIVDSGVSFSRLQLQDEDGNPLQFLQANWDDKGIIVYFGKAKTLSQNQIELMHYNDEIKVYPNPFSKELNLEVELLVSNSVSLTIENFTGQIVKEFQTEYLTPGKNTFKWIPGDLPSGIYICRVTIGNLNYFRKLSYFK